MLMYFNFKEFYKLHEKDFRKAIRRTITNMDVEVDKYEFHRVFKRKLNNEIRQWVQVPDYIIKE